MSYVHKSSFLWVSHFSVYIILGIRCYMDFLFCFIISVYLELNQTILIARTMSLVPSSRTYCPVSSQIV